MPAPTGKQFIKLYRGLEGVSPDTLDVHQMGIHWTTDPDTYDTHEESTRWKLYK